MAPRARARRRLAYPDALFVAWLWPVAVLAAPQQRSGRGAAGSAAAGGSGKVGGDSLNSLLHPSADHTLDPRGPDYEPRPGPGEEGHDVWAFGKAHAALHHVLDSVPTGEPKAALTALEAFSAEHNLSFGLGQERSAVLTAAVGEALAAAAAARAAPGAERGQQVAGLTVLALGPGLGGSVLHCLPTLLGIGAGLRGGGAPLLVHEIVSVEGDEQLSSGGARLVAHALGEGELQERVRHTPLIAGEDTVLEEVLETLRDGYDLPAFDVVLLEGGPRGRQKEQLSSLLRASALREGAVVHAEGPAEGEEGADALLEAMRGGSDHGSPRFDARVHQVGQGKAAVVATYRGRDGSEL